MDPSQLAESSSPDDKKAAVDSHGPNADGSLPTDASKAAPDAADKEHAAGGPDA